MKENIVLDSDAIKRALTRMTYEIIERNKGTEDMVDEYHNYWFHIKGSLIGEVLALVICAIVGLVIQFIL